MTEPVAERIEVTEVLGPHTIIDPYRWLEDAADPRTVRWLDGQDQLFRQAQGGWGRREWFRRRLGELTSFEDCSLPVWRGSRAFYTCRGPDDELASLRTRDYARSGRPAGDERVILDPVGLDPAARTTLDAWQPSHDGRLIACQFSVGGTEESLLYVVDSGSGAFVGPPIGGCRFSSVAWRPDRDAFYYVRDSVRGDGPKVWLHEAGAAAEDDAEVFGAGLGEISELDIALDRHGRHLLVTVVTGLSSATDIWVVAGPGMPPPRAQYPIAACPDAWKAVWPGSDGLLYLLTDDQAPRGRVVVVDASLAGTDPGRTLVAQDEAAVLEGFAILDGPELDRPVMLVLRNRADGVVLSLHDLGTGECAGQVALPGAGAVADLSCRQDPGHEAWLTYADALTPPTVYRYDAITRDLAPWNQALATAMPRGVTATELRYQSGDGTPVRLLLTRPAGTSGPLPTILQGYGAFGESQTADYYELALAWAEAGGLFAVACVRGGGEEGEAWHQAGMGENKQRGVDDLLAAARHLVDVGLSAPEKLGVKGFSAGGLLAAAAFIQSPDLFAAAECTSPLLDMARYELSGLGRLWTGEFGSRENPEQLGWMLGYSPYHNVAEGTGYPAVLLATFDGDTRVDPMHARKMCAALQRATSSARPVLLRTEAGVGHGERSRSARLDYFADMLGFFAHVLTDT